MASTNSLAKITWLVDTLRRVGRMSRAEISRRWAESSVGNGDPLPRRSFFNYRTAILNTFGINIEFDSSTYEYYIAEDINSTRSGAESVTNWLLDSSILSGVLSDSHSISDRIFLEPIPSARQNLVPIIDAIKNNHVLRFSYHPYTRSMPSDGILVEPYLLKLFRQRWYVAGRNVAENKLKTYALDRISNVVITEQSFEMMKGFDPATYFNDAFGIVVDSSTPRLVTIKAPTHQAKYLRALPLHPSQTEMVNNEYSIFSYKVLITPDFLQELMSLGPNIEVLAPVELRSMLVDRLRQTLALYTPDSKQKPE